MVQKKQKRVARRTGRKIGGKAGSVGGGLAGGALAGYVSGGNPVAVSAGSAIGSMSHQRLPFR